MEKSKQCYIGLLDEFYQEICDPIYRRLPVLFRRVEFEDFIFCWVEPRNMEWQFTTSCTIAEVAYFSDETGDNLLWSCELDEPHQVHAGNQFSYDQR